MGWGGGVGEWVYEHPSSLFTADFIGQSNLLHCTVKEVSGDDLVLECAGLSFPAVSAGGFAGASAVLCLRPQRIRYGSTPQHGMSLKGIITSKDYSGGMQHTQITLNDSITLNAVSQSAEMDSYAVGSEVYVGWSIKHAPVVPDEPSSREAV